MSSAVFEHKSGAGPKGPRRFFRLRVTSAGTLFPTGEWPGIVMDRRQRIFGEPNDEGIDPRHCSGFCMFDDRNGECPHCRGGPTAGDTVAMALPNGERREYVIDLTQANDGVAPVRWDANVLPLMVIRLDGRWYVDPRPLIAARQATQAVRDKKKPAADQHQ